MNSFFPFFIILLSGLFLSTVFRKLNVPWVVALIAAGVIIGPFGLSVIEINETLDFISETGLVLLMFMAGLETRLSSFSEFKGKMILLGFINGFIPAIVGFLIAYFFGLDISAAILVGIIFVSSSIAVVIPSLEGRGMLETPLGASVVATSIVQDVASLVLLSVFLQSESSLSSLPLIVLYPLVILILIIIRVMLPGIQKLIILRAEGEDDHFQRDIRAVLVVLFGTVILFELLGLHPIIAGFFAGFVLSESLKSEILHEKIRAISYGIFIPTFFIVVGTRTNLNLLLGAGQALLFTLVIIVGSMMSKFISGTLGAKSLGFNNSQSMFFGASSVPQLSTTLAATFTAARLDIFPNQIITSMVALSVVSTVVAPLSMAILDRYVLSTKDVVKLS